MWTVAKTEVADLLRLDLLARRREARERLDLFEHRYDQSFAAFEERMVDGEEDFGQWDDYVEWKAYVKVYRDLEAKIEALHRGDFTVT